MQVQNLWKNVGLKMLASWFPGSDCQLLPYFYGGSVSWERCQVPRLTACAYSAVRADAWPKVAQSGYGGIKQLTIESIVTRP